MQKNWDLVALHQIRGVGWHLINHLLEAGWLPGEKISSEAYEYLSLKRVSTSIIKQIKTKLQEKFIKKVKEECRDRNIQVVTYFDECYPPLLKEIAQPPWILYVRGNVESLQYPCLAVVGSRKPTKYGNQMTRHLVGQLVKHGFFIVSGLAYGIDAEAHHTAIKEKGNTIGVLASGVDVVYPKRNRQLYEEMIKIGAVVSESPPGTPATPGLFPLRNRIISGLSMGTLVIEAAEKSGTLITAHSSLEQGREVFALPGPVNSFQSRGTLRLIQQGAKCVITIEDILDELPAISVPAPQNQELLNGDEKRVLISMGNEPIQITTLLENLADDLRIGEIHQSLLTLEMKKYICSLPGGYYMINDHQGNEKVTTEGRTK